MPRALAHHVLLQIEREDAYSHIALDAALARATLEPRDRGLATELVYGTLTWQRTLDRVLSKFVNRSLGSLDPEVRVSLRMGLYQLLYLDRVPDHAAVSETVALVKRVRPPAAGLANGVLRAVVRGLSELKLWREDDPRPDRYLGERYGLPTWINKRLLKRYGLEEAEAAAEAFAARPPLYLRATSSEVPDAEPVAGVPGAWRAGAMTEPLREALTSGSAWVQDLGSQLLALLGEPRPGERVLDACAGLGGKTLAMAERVGEGGRVVAVEPQVTKRELSERALTRAGLAGRVTHIDATLQGAGLEDGSFDLVLVDAPCTGLGVLRRHPETRWRRTPDQIAELAEIQKDLLGHAARLVAPGGRLVYCVCTFTQEEGPDQVASFLEGHPEFAHARPEGHEVDWTTYAGEDGTLRLMPHLHDTDAFYAARLIRGV